MQNTDVVKERQSLVSPLCCRFRAGVSYRFHLGLNRSGSGVLLDSGRWILRIHRCFVRVEWENYYVAAHAGCEADTYCGEPRNSGVVARLAVEQRSADQITNLGVAHVHDFT